ncbi:zinc finger CCCH domain-containing protein 18-like isoform X5 [Juglans microcarpa x Juglans regia]|uniref:zinc finger CCCH domain-containing protein 18-like isoform X5 n=1 Tax=Juglans microcarpa x Juglans regia TaxID=2249226 RepID=UPI001B7E60BA|nr:zinc finger CCCH domain-containing protein 18-like isoform X5 [Juglans microcarpa x Juglans regia]
MMDFSEYTRIVFNKIKKLEPENATKIIGYLLLQDRGDHEMVRLALGPDNLIHEMIYKAKAELYQLATKSTPSPISPLKSPVFSPFSHVSSRPYSSATEFGASSPRWDPQLTSKYGSDFILRGCSDSTAEFQNQTHFLGLEDPIDPANCGLSGFSNDYFYPDAAVGNLSVRASRRFSSLPEVPVKTCHYFNKGFCKHGSSCRYFHGQVIPESLSQMYGNDAVNEDQFFSPRSLEKLELEIVEILKSRRGNPVSIASLPMIYYEKFGKVLQAEGYLTESQRHGKAGYSLTKLLARLKNSIQLIDRPHGQHAVILAEDAAKYMENRNEKSDPGPIVSGSRQIYLTFPAESTFTEEDVSTYFSTFGPVEDVRIPCQQKRMFGFVTFISADTVKIILAKGNPHFVCGARVLVKPYREKSKLNDSRRFPERIEPQLCYSPNYVDMESELHAMPRGCETSRLLRRQLMEEQEQALELERMRLAELQLARKSTISQPYFGYMDGLKVSDDPLNLPSAERFNYLLDVLSNGSASDDGKPRHTDTHTDQESQSINLPESPFASPIASSISTVI